MRRILCFLIPFLYLSSANALPQCSGRYNQKTWTDCVGTRAYANGDKYVGEWEGGKRNGRGTYIKVNGDKYVGEWKDGLRNGYFTVVTGPKSRWRFRTSFGEFIEGKPVWPHTFIYEGGRREIGRLEDGVVVRDFAEEERRKAEEERIVKGFVGLQQTSSGTAFAVSPLGHLVTNNHVIDGCEVVAIHQDGVTIPVSIVTRDLQNDLAVLKGEFSPIHIFPIRGRNPVLLEDIYVAGFPFGYNYSSSIKVTKGIISALTGVGNNFSNFQIDAALQPGNSGGPILDENGSVIGVAVARLNTEYALTNWGALPENINFGIKSNVVMSLLESQRIRVFDENSVVVGKRKLGERISEGTYYVSCWMTAARINQKRETKLMFENIN